MAGDLKIRLSLGWDFDMVEITAARAASSTDRLELNGNAGTHFFGPLIGSGDDTGGMGDGSSWADVVDDLLTREERSAYLPTKDPVNLGSCSNCASMSKCADSKP